MEQIILAYGLPKESHHNDFALRKHKTNDSLTFFNIVSEVLQEDVLLSDMFIICLAYILWTSVDLMKENDFILTKQEANDIPHV